jgi:hypothetical protein
MAAPHKGDNIAQLMARYMDSDLPKARKRSKAARRRTDDDLDMPTRDLKRFSKATDR